MKWQCYWKILLIYIGIIFLLYFQRKKQLEKVLINSDTLIYSFNPIVIQLTLNIPIYSSNSLSITDKHLIHFQLTNFSMITMIFSEGYHRLVLSMFDLNKQIEYYQTIDISTGSQVLIVTVVNIQLEIMKNISVHLELIDHPHVYLNSRTNQFGQVTFFNLPKSLPIYIEAICQQMKSQAYIHIDYINQRNLTLILKEIIRSSYDDGDEYDSSDRGYYAI